MSRQKRLSLHVATGRSATVPAAGSRHELQCIAAAACAVKTKKLQDAQMKRSAGGHHHGKQHAGGWQVCPKQRCVT